jgi:Tol biopolymer transport system component
MGFEKAGEAYFSPSADMIAFQAVPDGDSHYQIYVMHLDENVPHMVSTGLGACTCAYFHPNGSKMIFASSHSDPNPDEFPNDGQNGRYTWDLTPYMNIYESNLDGSEMKPLTTGPSYHAECAYSPDGSRIVYASNEDGYMNLYTMKSDGSDVRQVTYTTNCYNGGPFFSPDGQKIIFRSDRDIPHYLQIYVIDADGNNERQVTDNDAVNWAPYWHPNGEVIAYTTSIHGHYLYQIYLLNLVTGAESRLTYGKCFDGLPVFSPDGQQLLWTSKRGPDNTCQIFIADFIMPSNL